MQRLANAFRSIFGSDDASTSPCPNCERLAREVDYWRGREERTADRLLESRGLAPVAHPPISPVNSFATVMTAMQMTEVPQTSPPGREAMMDVPARR